MNITITVTGDDALRQAALLALPALKARTTAAVHQFSTMLVDRIQAAASGRPGPNIVTGNLYGSILIDHNLGDTDGWGVATVYTDVPYSRRLELGFYGTDSLGRSYNQQPYPFFSRAVEGSVSEFIEVMQSAVNGG
jgi:hypothetical protein